MVGKTISHYQILDKLGEGGMGVVYKARDTHLDRFVAIKVLPPERVADPARKRRFVQEAKAASALNHPSIVTIHDIDRADGADFMAMEYVQGKTLGKLIGCKGLSLKNTLHYGVQAADALAKAHAAGIVHRDLKPSNIMITEDGLVKILDFGLAKLTEAGLSGEDQSTRTLRTTTEEGTIVGTVAYMSPEQAEGKPVDVRSDIFSFGTVLYEMLAGHRPFQGDSQLSTLTSILRDSPAPIERARPDIPRELRHIVCRCLEKDREARYASAVELHKELLAFQDTLVPAVSYRALVRNPKWLAAGAMLLTAAVAVSVWLGVRVQRARWARNVALPQIEQLVEKGGTYAAYRLIRQAEKYIPGDPRLQALRQSSSVEVSVRTTPPGAEIYMADGHAAAEGGWELLGMSPVENVRIPNGLIRWRVVKQGFENVEAASAASWPRQFSLLPQGTSPPGMVHVPGGDFVYGSLAPVKLGDYWLDRCEVTNGQFKEFVRAGGYQKREYWRHPFIKGNRALNWEEAMAEFRDTTGRPGPATWELGTYPQGQADFPVGGVSWYEAAAYAEFVGKSLPTLYHWNNAVGIWSLVFPIATLSNMGGAGPARVGSFRSLGAHGTYDQAGNVKEWCWNQVGGNRYILGGAWSDPLYMFAESENLPPLDRSATNGFRCAKYKAPLPETMTAPIQRLVRDFSKEMPVTDEVFQFYRSIYAYDRSDLKAAVEAVDDSSEHWRKEKISFNAAYGN